MPDTPCSEDSFWKSCRLFLVSTASNVKKFQNLLRCHVEENLPPLVLKCRLPSRSCTRRDIEWLFPFISSRLLMTSWTPVMSTICKLFFKVENWLCSSETGKSIESLWKLVPDRCFGVFLWDFLNTGSYNFIVLYLVSIITDLHRKSWIGKWAWGRWYFLYQERRREFDDGNGRKESEKLEEKERSGKQFIIAVPGCAEVMESRAAAVESPCRMLAGQRGIREAVKEERVVSLTMFSPAFCQRSEIFCVCCWVINGTKHWIN